MTTQNHSRNYYVSNQNMSDIKESIQQYSMNFQKQSGIHGNSKSRSEIAEMISGSHQATQSRVIAKSKVNLPKQPTIIQQNAHQPEIIEQDRDQPIYLGDHVFSVIRERYFQTVKITTDDPEVLYDFFLSQRKQIDKMKPVKDSDIEKQMPSMQRKLLIKKKFQSILTYYPQDVYYSLCCQAEKIKKDRQLQQKVQFLNRGAQENKGNKVSEVQMKTIVDRLYKTKGGFGVKQSKLSPEEIQKIQRIKFGRNLSEHFQNAYRQKGSPANVETVDKLYNYWENIYQREDYNIQWPQQTAKQAIEQYMYEQVEDLMHYANRKLGFKCGKAVSLFKLYQKNYQSIQNIYIPINSFEEYVKIYNAVEKRRAQTELAQTKKYQSKLEQNRKKSEVKKFGRPVSATPISILSKAKTHSTQIQQLATKYPKDKTLKTLMMEQNLKKPRYAFQYGVYDIEQQIKQKQWVKIDPKKPQTKYQDMIKNKLSQTFSNPEFNEQDFNQVMSLLAEQQLEKDQKWKKLGPVLQQAMLVKAHQDAWFRECIIRYLERITTGQNFKLETNQVIFSKLMSHLNSLTQSQKSNQFQKLESLILTSQSIAEKTKKIENMEKIPSEKQKVKQKRLLNALLLDKATQYVRMRVKKTNHEFILRNYLKELFQQCMKEHKNYVKKHFNVVEGDKQCPKLLKYEFFRFVKEINPITFQRESVLKNHAWVPPKQTPDKFNPKTYNTFSQFYIRDRNVFNAQPERQKYKETIWGRKKSKDRENLIMTYQDAKECVFHPKLSKKA